MNNLIVLTWKFVRLPIRLTTRALRTAFALVSLASVFAASSASATLHYVDSTATGANNGTSWANAWTSLSSMSGLAPGDTVYISGGASGSSRTYSIGSGFPVTSGTSGGIITYQIGQDSLHNGTAVFSGSGTFIGGSPNYFAIVGDAGDGQMHFATSGFSVIMWGGVTESNVRIGYINFGQMAGSGGSNGGVITFSLISGLEFDHNYVYCSAPDANDFMYAHFSGSGWDSSRIHDNTVYIPHASSAPGDGADAIETGGSSSLSIYNNVFVGYSLNYTGGQHQDGWQDTGGTSYIKVYNNIFMDIGNYPIFGDGYYGSFNNVLVFNNIFCISDPSIESAGSAQACNIGLDGGYIGPSPAPFVNVVMANNIAVDYGSHGTFGISDQPSNPIGVFTGCTVANNVGVNSGDFTHIGNGVTTPDDLLTVTSAQAVKMFTRYTALGGLNNDYHLISGATSLIGQGMNLSAYFTTDKGGSTRPATAAWDIGPYQFGSSGGGTNSAPALTLSPISDNATDVDPATSGLQVYEGTSVQYSGTATETGSATVSWQWVYQVNGGAQVVYASGTGPVTPVSFDYVAGTGGNTYLWTLKASDGTTSLSSQLTMSVEVPPAPQTGLTFQASQAASITAPFVLASGYISQPIQTTVIASAGQAAFNFSITNAGNYVIQATVNAPNDAANSFYVNIDALPVDPTMCWDVMPLTTNFQQRIVSWRGTGSDTNNQYIPKIFNLATGSHQIIFAGREANTQLQSFSLLQLPNAPQNLRVLPTVVNAPTFSVGP